MKTLIATAILAVMPVLASATDYPIKVTPSAVENSNGNTFTNISAAYKVSADTYIFGVALPFECSLTDDTKVFFKCLDNMGKSYVYFATGAAIAGDTLHATEVVSAENTLSDEGILLAAERVAGYAKEQGIEQD